MKSNTVDVKIKLLTKTAKVPTKGTDGSAAYDLYVDIEKKIVMQPMSTLLVDTGIALSIPKGYCGLVLPRSGISLKSPIRISNAPGLIDSDYTGPIKVIIDNIGQGFATIDPGTRIAQLMIMPVPEVRFLETDTLDETIRGENGFGSTGTK